MIYDILEKKLADAAIGLAPGKSIFREAMPGNCKKGVMFKGPLGGIPIDPYIEGYHKGKLQAIVRHTDPVLGEKLANQVIKALIVDAPQLFEATADRGPAEIKRLFPAQLPIKFPLLEGNMIEWSLNFDVAFALQPAWR